MSMHIHGTFIHSHMEGKQFGGGVVTFFVVLVVFNNSALKFWSMIK